MNLIDLISSKIELFRLEQRYTKRRHRRSTFVSDAQYVDGEYIYSAASKRASVLQFSSSSQESMAEEEWGSMGRSRGDRVERAERAERERGDRTERERLGGYMGGEGRGNMEGGGKEGSKKRWNSARAFKRRSMLTVQEVRWEEDRS